MKPYKFLLLLFIAIFSLQMNAQVEMNYKTIDAKTYNQYIKKDWNELIKTGKTALKNNIDFYYLQVRMGIAYYNLRKFTKATKHFEKAYSSNSENELIQEYLYYSYIYMGRYEDARVLAASFKRNLKKRLGISAENPTISAFHLETKQDINEDYEYTPNPDEIVNQQTVLNQSYYNVSLLHLIGSRTSIYQGYSNIGITNSILSDDINLPESFEENISQHEYYFSLNSQIAKGTGLSIGFHALHTNYSALDPNPTTVGRWGGTDVYLYDYSKNSFAGSLSLSKHFYIFKITTGISVANLNDDFQLQPEGSLKIYPFGNGKFYTNSKAIYLIDDNGITTDENFIFKQSIGINFLKYSWFVPSVTFGNLKNYTSYNALIANNDIDLIKQKYEAYVNFGFSKGTFNVFLKYQYNVKENSFTVNNIEKTKEYINQSITAGVTWYFKKY